MAEDDKNKKMSEEEAMQTKSLPEVVITDILSRLPVESLLRFKCVCKLWYALITDPVFVKMHLRRSLSTHSNLSLIFQSNYTFTLSIVDLDAYQQGAVTLFHPLKSHDYNTIIVGSCNGLICIANYDDELFLWNPSIRRHQKLPITPIKGLDYFSIFFGLGYESMTDDFKLVAIVGGEVHVYSLTTNSWRKMMKDMPFQLCDTYRFGAFANSALHWQGTDTTSRFIIVSFDLKDEEIREVPLPDLVEDDEFQMDMAMGVLGEQLCLQCTLSKVRDEFWVMKDYGVRDSWTKLFLIEQPSVIRSYMSLMPICYSKNGEVILERDYNHLGSYDLRRGVASKLRIGGSRQDFSTIPCLGSLVPLNDKDVAEQPKKEENEYETEEEEEEGTED